MSILGSIKAVLGSQKKPEDNDEELLCALVFARVDNGTMVQSKVIGPTPGARTFEDVNSLVLTAMVCALEEFERKKKALVAANVSQQEFRQILLVDSYAEGADPVGRAVDALLRKKAEDV